MLGQHRFGGSIPFFLAQALGITFEDGVVAIGKRLEIRHCFLRGLGYAWVALWLTFTWSLSIDKLMAQDVRAIVLSDAMSRPLWQIWFS
jgi:hypothetical protein